MEASRNAIGDPAVHLPSTSRSTCSPNASATAGSSASTPVIEPDPLNMMLRAAGLSSACASPSARNEILAISISSAENPFASSRADQAPPVSLPKSISTSASSSRVCPPETGRTTGLPSLAAIRPRSLRRCRKPLPVSAEASSESCSASRSKRSTTTPPADLTTPSVSSCVSAPKNCL